VAGGRISSSRPSWSISQVPGQPVLHSKAVSQKNKNRFRRAKIACFLSYEDSRLKIYIYMYIYIRICPYTHTMIVIVGLIEEERKRGVNIEIHCIYV
jgi:hypothetical protein